MLRKVTFINAFILISISHSIEEGAHSECYPAHCYLWNEITTYYNELQTCPKPYWDLEIYNEQLQNGVLSFLKRWHRETSTRIVDINVPLNLYCKNSTYCTWKQKNQIAMYLNWDNDIEWNRAHDIYYLQFPQSTWKAADKTTNATYAKLCMRKNIEIDQRMEIVTNLKNIEIDQTTEIALNLNHWSKHPINLWTIIGIILFIVSFIFGVIFYLITRKKRNSRIDAIDPHPSIVANLELVVIDNSNYAHLNRANRAASSEYQDLREYENTKCYHL